MLFGQFGIDVVLGIFFLLEFFEFVEFITNFRVVLLKQTPLESFDGLCIAFHLRVDGSFASKYFCLLDIILDDAFLEELFSLCDFGQGSFIVLQLDVSSSLVVVVEGLIGVQLYCFLIEVDGFVEVFLLECFISLVFHVFSGVFNIHLFRFLLFLFRRRGRRM